MESIDFVLRRPTKEEKEKIRLAFSKYDDNGDNRISKHELVRAMRSMNINITLDEAEDAINQIDSNLDGYVGYPEFEKTIVYEICKREHENRVLREVFDMFDLNKDGYISKDELVRILRSAGDRRDQAEKYAEELLQEADDNHDGRVSFKEFLHVFRIGS